MSIICIVMITGAIVFSPIIFFCIQLIVNYRISKYFGLPIYAFQKQHHLTKLGNSLLILMKHPPETAKIILQNDFLTNALPLGIIRLKSGYSMHLITHLISEKDLDLLPFEPQWENHKPNALIIGSTQVTAWLITLLSAVPKHSCIILGRTLMYLPVFRTAV